MTHPRRGPRAGFSMMDVAVGIAIFGLVSLVALTHLHAGWREAEQNAHRNFAYERAESILEELRAFAEVNEVRDAAELDQFDDGTSYSHVLTIARKPAPNDTEFVSPDDALSGNFRTGSDWRYARRITVRHFPGLDTRDLRVVTVRMYLHDRADPPGSEIATVSSVVRTTSDAVPPSQVFDVYLVAIENVPGWWVYMDTIKPFIEASLTDLAARNPGLRFRTHWITKLAYGRNPQYTPYFNEAAPSTDAIDKVYFYPGRMPDSAAALRYYVADNVAARIDVDGTVRNTYDATGNPWPYTLADQYNHALRLPDEERLFAARVAAGTEDPEEPTWRMLLENMNREPEQYRNAIIVNLHGELLPMPPLRNYSDAARDPEVHPGVRVVTHPEKLRFFRDPSDTASEDVRLRVHTYKTDPAAGPPLLAPPTIVEIAGMDLTANVNGTGVGTPTLEVRRVAGGLDLDPIDGTPEAYFADVSPVTVGSAAHVPAYAGEMYARVRFASPGGGLPGSTVIELHNSPLTAPVVGTQGLDAGRRLYGMEYVPCSTEAANDFSTDLTATTTGEKNTARWVVTIPAGMLGTSDRRITVTTRIGLGDAGNSGPDGAAFATGIMYPPALRDQPENISRTYVWWADTPDSVPFTERFQFQGDPRHCPYADLKAGGSSFPNGYNWFFDDFEDGTNDVLSAWPGFDAARIKNDGVADNDGWEGRCEVDVPRLFQLLRRGLTRSESLWTTLTGFSYYYLGVGNEIGYDSANGFPSSIPVSGRPFGQSGDGFEQAVTSSGGNYGTGPKLVRSSDASGYWWGMPWLGELYPDSHYASDWRVPRFEYAETPTLPSPLPAPRGNLPAGAGAGEFYRVSRGSVTPRLPPGTDLLDCERRTNAEGATSMFNIGTSGSTFHHQHQTGTSGPITAAGIELASDFHFPLPQSALVSRPFRLATNADGGEGDEFGFTTDYPRYSATLRTPYYGHTTGATGSALVELANPTATKRGYVLVSGIDRTSESGSGFIARFSMLTLIHGFLSAGDPGLPTPVSLPPRLVITAPTAISELNDPSTISITWHTEWRRWDGSAYTSVFPSGFSLPETDLEYALLYSPDNGATWRNVIDDSIATPGVLPAPSLRRPDVADGGDEAYTWNVPDAAFPEGSYVLRVEAYRTGARLHYSYHEEKVFLNR